MRTSTQQIDYLDQRKSFVAFYIRDRRRVLEKEKIRNLIKQKSFFTVLKGFGRVSPRIIENSYLGFLKFFPSFCSVLESP